MDHAATTPVDEEVLKDMMPFFSEKFGNPSSIYKLGREAKSVLELSRQKTADLLGAGRANEIIFTSGATESNNLAIKGVSESAAHILMNRPHIITTSIEHHCVLDTVKYLEGAYGAEVTYLPVNHEGVVDLVEIEKAIKDNTALISIMMGNNEVGSIQPIAEIGKIVRATNDQRQTTGNKLPVYFHTDAVQAFAFEEINVQDLGVDMLSLTAHKFYGPKGVGLLYVKSGTKFVPQQKGGAQERGLRAGTENVPYIVGMVSAMELADAQRKNYKDNTQKITEYLIERVTKEIPEVELMGPKDKSRRLPHIANFIFRRVEGESILINLDMLGISASSGSACTSGSLEVSHVTKAMGYGDLESHGAIRFSLGKLNKKEDVDELMLHLPKIIDKLRAMSPVVAEGNGNHGDTIGKSGGSL
jgi:cysteine desulfurase